MCFLSRPRMRQYTAFAAVLLCVALLALVCAGVRSASDEAGALDCSVPIPSYSAAEKKHTRMFLDAIKESIPALASVWTCDNFCAHEGVECTEAGLHVRLNVEDFRGALREIPEEIVGSFVLVTKLTFSGNIKNLKGTLPASWHRLAQLSSIVFTSTSSEDTLQEMRGTSIESSIAAHHTGVVPGTLMNTASRASSTPVSHVLDITMLGPVPSTWAETNKLERSFLQKDVESRSLPEEWGNMHTIKVLNLTNLGLSGTLPSSWSSMSMLERLHAANNRLSGTLPASWGSLKHLLDLQLKGNNFVGVIPKKWGDMTALRSVSLQFDHCTCVPESWLARKVEVTIYSTVLGVECELTSDCGSSSTSSSSELECYGPIPFYTPSQQVHTQNFLEAFKNTIQDLKPLWTCPNFCVWEYVHCSPTGVAVEMTGTHFFGYVPEVPADVDPSEVVVDKVDFTRSGSVEGEYPSSWSLLTSLQHVSFANTSMWGTLPHQWSSMPALKYVDLSYTWVLGGFPDTWSSFEHLEVLRLAHLTIPDHLPASWSRMTTLRELDLTSTGVSGRLPPSWGALTNLEILSLSNNSIDANLPEQWSSLTRLRTLHLHDNHLSGPIPETYNNMVSLTRVSLEINRFCGCLPSEWAARNNVSLTITAQPEVLAPDCATANICTPDTEPSSSGSSAVSASSSVTSSGGSGSSIVTTVEPTGEPVIPGDSSSSSRWDTEFYDRLYLLCPNPEEMDPEIISLHKKDICCNEWFGSEHTTACGDNIKNYSNALVTCSGALGSRGFFSCCSRVGPDGVGTFLGTRCPETSVDAVRAPVAAVMLSNARASGAILLVTLAAVLAISFT